MKVLITALILVLFSHFSFAGQDRGGGKGIVCRGNQNEIQSVELLDIFEARLRGQIPVFNSDTVAKELGHILERTKYIFAREDKWVYDALQFDFRSFQECGYGHHYCGFIERIRGVDLPITQDSFEGPISLPSNCKIEQVAIFEHPGNKHWTINMDLVDKMDKMNLTAFILHESLYSLLHSWESEENSLRVRRAVGFIMSGASFLKTADILRKPYIHCASPEAWDDEDSLYFTQDTSAKIPKVVMYANRIRFSKLINFNDSILKSKEINVNSRLEEFYSNLNSGNIKIEVHGSPNNIEFLSRLRFELKNGIGTFYQDALTGGGPIYAPVGNFKCNLVQ
ncbi:MAG: hypothetical protein ACAH59_02070 [Pseudobdellovibrionaceae bacterium]